MRFHVAWESLESQNHWLKVLVIFLLLLGIALTIVIGTVGIKAPIVVERGCFTRVADHGAPNPSDDEIKGFTEEAIKARFNSGASNGALLTHDQLAFREKEQTELLRQKMRQSVIVNSVDVQKDSIKVDGDRLIAVGDVRSTFRFPLTVKIEKTSRSEGNPYGLVLSEINQPEEVRK